MRVLVTGGTGLLGWWLAKTLAGRGYRVVATYHSKEPRGLDGVEWVRLDLSDPAGSLDALRGARPDAIIHAAAYTDVDGCELDKGRALRVNYLGTAAIARLASRLGAYLVYVSTDYVFDGERGMYSERDPPNPVNYYGLTKLLGEAAVGAAAPEGLVLRVSGLYGYSPTGKRNFALNALESLLAGREVRAFRDQRLSPTYTPHLAEAVARILEAEPRPTGILHLAGEAMSRLEFALLLASAAGADRGLVKPASMSDLRLPARRPRDSSLDTGKAEGELGLKLPPTSEAVSEFVRLYKSVRGL